ncbi:acn, partial [Symbiodinium microadriaticum]
MEIEMERNSDRFQFLKWAQQSFQNFNLVSHGMQVHSDGQVVLEHQTAERVWQAEEAVPEISEINLPPKHEPRPDADDASCSQDKAVNETMSGITPRFDDAMFTDSGRIHHEGSRKPPAAAVVCNWSPKVPPETWSGAPEWTKGYLRLQSWRTSMWPDSAKILMTLQQSLTKIIAEAGRPVQAYLGDLADRAYELSDVGGQVALVQDGVVFPDACVGTDSHTTMINGMGIYGFGCGGLEVEAAMLGQPTASLIPDTLALFRLLILCLQPLGSHLIFTGISSGAGLRVAYLGRVSAINWDAVASAMGFPEHAALLQTVAARTRFRRQMGRVAGGVTQFAALQAASGAVLGPLGDNLVVPGRRAGACRCHDTQHHDDLGCPQAKIWLTGDMAPVTVQSLGSSAQGVNWAAIAGHVGMPHMAPRFARSTVWRRHVATRRLGQQLCLLYAGAAVAAH